MIPQVAPYTPRLYQPDAYGRYRQYPRNVRAPIPGVGYDVGALAWAEQELNLDGDGPPMHYGSYRTVPLRGLGLSMQDALRASAPSLLRTSSMSVQLGPVSSGGQEAGGSAPTERTPEQEAVEGAYDAAADVERAAAAAQAAAQQSEEPGFFSKKVGPVPVWALLVGGVAVAGGGAWWFMRRKR